MKTILMTGARSGIAADVIKKLKTKNYKIYVAVHTDTQCKRIKKISKNDKNIYCIKLDVTDKEDIKKLNKIDVDILISFAAIGNGGLISEIKMDKVRENFEVNVFSNFEIVQIVIKNMIKKDSGKIIMISSLAGILPLKFLGSYCATKSSIIMLTQVLKKEIKLISKNIKISLIEPGMYHTGFNQVMLENKYDWMSINSYFEEQLNIIRKKKFIF